MVHFGRSNETANANTNTNANRSLSQSSSLSPGPRRQHQRRVPPTPQHLTAESVAALPPPGLTGPSSICFSSSHTPIANIYSDAASRTVPSSPTYLAFLSTTVAPPVAGPRKFQPAKLQSRFTTTTTTNTNANDNNTASGNASIVTTTGERQLCVLNLNDLVNSDGGTCSSNDSTAATIVPPTEEELARSIFPLLKLPPRTIAPSAKHAVASNSVSLEERLRRERQRLHTSGGPTQFSWVTATDADATKLQKQQQQQQQRILRILVPLRGNIYIQNGVQTRNHGTTKDISYQPLTQIYDKANHANLISSTTISAGNSSESHTQQQPHKMSGSVVGRDASAIDPQLSPDGSMVAFVIAGDIHVVHVDPNKPNQPIRITYGASTGSGSSSDQPQPQHYATTNDATTNHPKDAVDSSCITHGLADFIAQEEMDRYRGYWWDPQSNGILFTKVDETCIPPYRITHQGRDGGPNHSSGEEATYEDHRYPFAGKENPKVTLGYVAIDRSSICRYGETEQETNRQQQERQQQETSAIHTKVQQQHSSTGDESEIMCTNNGSSQLQNGTTQQQQLSTKKKERNENEFIENDKKNSRDKEFNANPGIPIEMDDCDIATNMNNKNKNDVCVNERDPHTIARTNWSKVKWLDPPREGKEYLARVSWLPDGAACVQWQNRTQTTLVVVRIDIKKGTTRTLLTERSEVWINLHHMMRVLPRPVHPDECSGNVRGKPSISTIGATTTGSTKTRTSPVGRGASGSYRPHLPAQLPPGSFSFLFASERTGYSHVYLYTYAPGWNEERAVLIRAVSDGNWMVESIEGIDMEKDTLYVTGTYDSPLERHLYALPITGRSRPSGTENMESSNAVDSTMSRASGCDLHDEQSKSDTSDKDNGGVRRGFKHVISALSGAKSSPFRRSNSSMLYSGSHGDSMTTPNPDKLTTGSGMHAIVMDDDCRFFVDTSSDLERPTSVKVYILPETTPCAGSDWNNDHLPLPTKQKRTPQKTSAMMDNTRTGKQNVPEQQSLECRLFFVLFDASKHVNATPMPSFPSTSELAEKNWLTKLPPPELLSFPTSDGTEMLHAALYRPDPRVHGSGPYPLICAVYGGPHVQRVNRSWSQCADMRAQRLRSLGFAVVKCDNRGSSRRGLAFESAIRSRLGRLEVLDQVTAVRQLAMRGIADPTRVGIYGWSYGGYLASMCLCRAPDVFHVAVAGAPVTSWDGYDTHYTERYMGLPADNPSGYRESAIFDHVPNMRGELMIVHGLIDENVHFRHTARLINRLIAAGKDYDLLIFPDERHSPRRLRDRIYMEQRISDYFLKNLCECAIESSINALRGTSQDNPPREGESDSTLQGQQMRTMAGHL